MTDDYLGKKVRESSSEKLYLGVFFVVLVIVGVAVVFGLERMDVHLSDRVSGFLLFMGGGFLLGSIIALGKWSQWRLDPNSHPMIASLRYYGDPAVLRLQIDQEVREAGPFKVGPASITKSWILFPGANVASLPVESVVWAYQKVTQHSTNGIKTHKSYKLCLRSREGVSVDVDATEETATAVLNVIGDRQPWTKIGFDDWTAHAFDTNRAAFLSTIDQRRDEIENRRPHLC